MSSFHAPHTVKELEENGWTVGYTKGKIEHSLVCQVKNGYDIAVFGDGELFIRNLINNTEFTMKIKNFKIAYDIADSILNGVKE